MKRKLKTVIVISLTVGASFGFLAVEHLTEPVATTVVPQHQIDSLYNANPSFKIIRNLSFSGDSEELGILLSQNNYALTYLNMGISLEVFKIAQNLSSPFSSMTFADIGMKETTQNHTTVLHPSLTMLKDTNVIFSMYTVQYTITGNYTVHFAISLEPVVEWGSIHQAGSPITISVAQNLTVHQTPP